MPRKTRTKLRLPSLNLLFLALILSGGGFFWHTTHQQQLINQCDNLLLTTARSIDYFSAEFSADQRQQRLCDTLPELHKIAPGTSGVTLYTSAGKFVCSSGERPSTELSQALTSVKSSQFTTRAEEQGYVRSLLYPVSSGKFYLQIDHSLDHLNKQSAIFTTLLFLTGIFILICFALLQRKLRSRNLVALRRLTKVINRTSSELVPPKFKVSEAADPEIQDLARSYNEMMGRRSSNLRRARQFAADVTHELRTPLTILRGETELALRSDREKEQLRQVLASNLEEISRMSYLIEDLLLLSKGDLGEIPLKMEHLPLNDLITELHHQAQLLATSKNIKVELRMPDQPIDLQADSFRLRQVLLNLLTNAIKYTPENGDVAIEVKTDNDNATISVIDSGIGMDAEHLSLIFNRFYRVDKTGNRNDGGSGLGLAIVKWIVDAHQGTITVDSTPGQGSRFTVILPRRHQEIFVAATTEDEN